MKDRKIFKEMFVLVLILALMALPGQLFAAGEDQQPQPSIRILRVMTLNNEKQPQTQFNLWHPVLFRIKYEITGDQDTRYKVKGIVRVFGEEIVVAKKNRPGVHRMLTALLVPGRVRPGEKTVKYKVKLKKGGELLDKDTATSEISILEPNPNLGYLRLVEKDSEDWEVVKGGARGLLRYTRTGSMFVFRFHGHGLIPNTSYTLIYYPDPWPGDGLICLASGTADYHGRFRHLVGAAKIDGGIPAEYDHNYPDGAKIWLVRSEDVDCGGKMMVDWNPTEYLFEHELITYPDTEGSASGLLEEIAAVNTRIKIRPRTLNLRSKEKWITCRIRPPKGYSVDDIDVSATWLEASIPVSRSVARSKILVVKFDRGAVQDLIEGMDDLKYPAELELYVTGRLLNDGPQFEGSDTIKVIK
jgi:hypothetical protein